MTARLVALLLLGAMDTVRSADSGANARFQVRCAFAANFTEGTHVGRFKEWIYSDYCTKGSDYAITNRGASIFLLDGDDDVIGDVDDNPSTDAPQTPLLDSKSPTESPTKSPTKGAQPTASPTEEVPTPPPTVFRPPAPPSPVVIDNCVFISYPEECDCESKGGDVMDDGEIVEYVRIFKRDPASTATCDGSTATRVNGTSSVDDGVSATTPRPGTETDDFIFRNGTNRTIIAVDPYRPCLAEAVDGICMDECPDGGFTTGYQCKCVQGRDFQYKRFTLETGESDGAWVCESCCCYTGSEDCPFEEIDDKKCDDDDDVIIIVVIVLTVLVVIVTCICVFFCITGSQSDKEPVKLQSDD